MSYCVNREKKTKTAIMLKQYTIVATANSNKRICLKPYVHTPIKLWLIQPYNVIIRPIL